MHSNNRKEMEKENKDKTTRGPGKATAGTRAREEGPVSKRRKTGVASADEEEGEFSDSRFYTERPGPGQEGVQQNAEAIRWLADKMEDLKKTIEDGVRHEKGT